MGVPLVPGWVEHGGRHMRKSRMLMVGLLTLTPIATSGCTYEDLVSGFSGFFCGVVPIFTGNPCELTFNP
jgi:hypothetical protein